MQLLAGIQKYFKCTSFPNVDFQTIFQMFSFLHVIADILIYPKSLGSTQMVEFSRRTTSQSATRHKNMLSAHRNMFSVLCEIGPCLRTPATAYRYIYKPASAVTVRLQSIRPAAILLDHHNLWKIVRRQTLREMAN
jgi:hypothetical protein